MKNNIPGTVKTPGAAAGIIMNLIHARLYGKIITSYIIRPERSSHRLTVLDAGCGGGAAVRIFAGLPQVSTVYGVDISEKMIRLARRLNRRKIRSGTVEILQDDVADLPFDNGEIDLVTAFDTINFWKDHSVALAEIRRILDTAGRFFIVNAVPEKGNRWYDFVKFKDEEDYKTLFEKGGFHAIETAWVKDVIIISGRNKHGTADDNAAHGV